MLSDPVLDAAVLNAACEETRNGILVLNSLGEVVKSNQRLAAMFALPADVLSPGAAGVIGVLASRLAQPSRLAGVEQAIAADRSSRLDEELELAGGSILELRTVPVEAADDRPPARLWMFRDVTEQRRAERRLVEEEAKFRGMVEQELAGVCIIDQAQRLAYANPLFAGYFQCEPEAIIGRPVQAFVPRDEWQRVQTALRALLAGQQTAVRLTYAAEDHGGRPVDMLVHAAAAQYRGAPAVIVLSLDISAVEAARRELTFANIIIEQSPVVLFQAEANPEFRRTYVSRNITRFGYTREQAYQGCFRFPDFVLPADRPAVMAGVQAMLNGSADLFEQDYRAIIADGSVRWLHARTVPIRDASGQTTAFRGTLIDVTERKQAEQSLAKVNRTLRTLTSGNEAMVRAASEQQLLDDMCRVLVEIGGYPLCWIGFVDPAGGGLPRIAALRQRDTAKSATERSLPAMVRPDSAAVAAVNRGSVVIQHRDECNCTRSDQGGEPCPWTASAAFPVTSVGAAPGVMVLAADTDGCFDADEIRLLSELASNLGFGIQSLRAHAARDANAQRLREIMSAIVQALINTLEQRDPYTAGHQRRVAVLSAEIARLMGLPDDDIEGITLAALVHDVGKIRVPAEILAKPGRLSRLEYQLVQAHAEAGYEILKGIDFPWPVARMVRQHHERMDGSGYPDALRGPDILMGSRIIAVADVVESMTTHRPYRPALGQEAALAEIARGRGRLYDAAVADACTALFAQHGFELPQAGKM